MSKRGSENKAYKSSEIPSVLCGTTDESFYENPEAKEMTQILIEMSRENKRNQK